MCPVFLGAFEKRLVSKLRHARERVRYEKGKCGGRKPHGELRPEVVAEAKRLRRAQSKTGERLSYRKIGTQLAAAGFVNERERSSASGQKRTKVRPTNDERAIADAKVFLASAGVS